jgi:N-acetyl-gamma-glutamyl-phosphate reductase
VIAPEVGADRVGVGVLGATGYSGLELIRLLASHPRAALRAVGSRQAAGERLSRVWPSHPGLDLVLDDDPADPAAWLDRGVEVVFAALPHGAFAARAEAFLAAGLRVVDLSGDFRLESAAEYGQRYGLEHPAPSLLGTAAYGLTEWCGAELEAASLVANPGCYATAVLLATLPAVAAGRWSGAAIVANALSGVSGAGRAPSLGTHFVEVSGGAGPYRVGEVHAHLGEMRQALARAQAGGSVGGGAPGEASAASDDTSLPLLFSPHLVPMSRGIAASIAVPLARRAREEEIRALYRERYAGHAFVRVLDGDSLPDTRHVRGSNRCDIAMRVGAGGTMLLAYAALDNLVKGAAGQAIQNWNRMQGWPEPTGLPIDGWAIA